MNIRLYCNEDFDDLCRLCRGVSDHYHTDLKRTDEEVREYVRDHVTGPDADTRIALAIDGDQRVGLVTFSIMYPSANLKGQLYMKELFVEEQARGKGAGLALMQFVARYALEHNCDRLDWSAEKTNPTALEFYTAVGASPLERKVYYRIAGDALESFAGDKKE